jgi:hypothetical protein
MRSNGARFALLIVLVAVAVGLFVVLSGGDDGGTDTPTTTNAQTPGGEPSTPAELAVTTITVKDGKPVGGVQLIEVSKGDQVRFKVHSENVTDEVHVHGYDLMQEVAPGESVTFEFPADLEGVFEAELENAGEQILELRVNP